MEDLVTRNNRFMVDKSVQVTGGVDFGSSKVTSGARSGARGYSYGSQSGPIR